MTFKTWRVTAEWVFHSKYYSEWMNEEDYETTENGEKLVHRYRLSQEDLSNAMNRSNVRATKTAKIAVKRNRSSSTSSKEIRSTRKRDQSVASEARKTATKTVLPTAQCPVCDKTMTKKALGRHIQEKHEHNAEEFSCNVCKSSFKRKELLLDHQRRKHFEPVKMGRPNKNIKTPRSRSPFRVKVFEDRHGSSIEILQMNTQMVNALNENKDQLNKFAQVLEQTQSEQKKNEDRLKELEKIKMQKEIELRKVKTRITMIESKQPHTDLPDLKDIVSLLQYFNLKENCTKTEVNDTINLRLMETSTESTVSRDIFTNMTEEEKQNLTIFLNKASEVLLRYVKYRNEHNKKLNE